MRQIKNHQMHLPSIWQKFISHVHRNWRLQPSWPSKPPLILFSILDFLEWKNFATLPCWFKKGCCGWVKLLISMRLNASPHHFRIWFQHTWNPLQKMCVSGIKLLEPFFSPPYWMWPPPYLWTSLQGGGYARGDEEGEEGGDGGDLHGGGGGGGGGSAAGKVPTGVTGERPNL